jgi:hypothetical protein
VDEAGAPMKWIPLVCSLLCGVAQAHVGTSDVYLEGNAGPYKLLVTVKTPGVIPGIAEIEVRSATPGIRLLKVAPMRLTGEGAKYPPTPDVVEPSKLDPQYFVSHVWLMQFGALQVRITAEGDRGQGEIAIPVQAAATKVSSMQPWFGVMLSALGLLLAVGVVSIAGAASREGRLEPGASPTAAQRRRARVSMTVAALLVFAILYGANRWWTIEANAYRRHLYTAPKASVSIQDGQLLLTAQERKLDALIPDHGHPMHLFAVRTPQMDRLLHLHPAMNASGAFANSLPAMDAGTYRIYADIVHGSVAGEIAETLTAELKTPQQIGRPLEGDDSVGVAPAVLGTESPLSSGARMIWERDSSPFESRRAFVFRFRIVNADGSAAEDLQPYMGMAGHAVFLSTDGSVFAHVHPSGSVPMPLLALASRQIDPHAGHHMPVPSTVEFPFGFPKAGDYRIFVQVKRGGRVETGFFGAHVDK